MNMALKRGSASVPSRANCGQDQKGILGKPSYKFQSKMTPMNLMNIGQRGYVFSVMNALLLVICVLRGKRLKYFLWR